MSLAGLLVGLGNPGSKYAGTRHNFGFELLDELARQAALAGRPASPLGNLGEELELCELKLADQARILLLKPLTFMNLSGRAVARVMRFYKIPPDKMLVAHDELDIALGRLKFKFGGGAAGHNGLSSIFTETGETQFYRLRLGIGRPAPGRDKASYVLSRFTPEEEPLAAKVFRQGAIGAEIFFRQSPAAAMQAVNGFDALLV